ncbi:hypothetical protein [Niveispirillum sp. KHB5.9]|uniref:hypothetical protein n=1 Tax=Niveispirillum sp. KHB5.9 TaxID=3400269 RepID=UPI003A8A7411
MSQHEAHKAQTLAQATDLKKKLLTVMGSHFTGTGEGAFSPEVALSALGSATLDLFIYMRQLGAPGWLLNDLAQVTDTYFVHLSEQIAAVAAGKAVTVTDVTVKLRRTAAAQEEGRG